MEWINEKAKTLKQGAIRAMFDRANTMTGVISLGIGEPDMPTPKLVCEAAKEALDKFKMEAANEVGVDLKDGYNGHLTSKEAGSVGGQMVKKMIESYEKGMK